MYSGFVLPVSKDLHNLLPEQNVFLVDCPVIMQLPKQPVLELEQVQIVRTAQKGT